MKGRHRSPGVMAILALTLALALGSGFSQPARAASEDVAMFYDDLASLGQWVDYESYGPVWVPSNVGEDWRPYTDGRWVPTNDGYVFESEEPWGWATYHYGNWMPTPGYGWVWVPGRTWYPSTVEWRTTPDTAPVDNSYVGWAPIPPPDYVPTSDYAPAGYYSGMPQDNLLTSPFWIFAQAASFLLGFGQPYTPAYSYLYQPCLVPPSYVPVFFGQTSFLPGYYAPSYYPANYLAPGFAGAYSYGPPANYISRVTNINKTVINQTINNNTVNITKIHSVMAPTTVLNTNAAIRNIQPPALTQGKPLPPAQRLTNVNQARANLNKPNIVAAPTNIKPLTARIPKASPLAAQPVRTGIPGTALPAKSMMKLTPAQQTAIGKVPAAQQIHPVAPPLRSTVSGKPAAPTGAFKAPGPAVTPPAPGGAKPGAVRPGTFVTPGAGPATPAQPAVPAKPGAVPSGTFKPSVTPPVAKPGYTPAPKPSYTPPAAKPSYTPPAGKPSYTPPQPKPSYTPPAAKPSYTPPAAKPSYTPPAGKPSYTPPAAPKPSYTPPRPSYTPPQPKPSYTPPAPKAAPPRPAPPRPAPPRPAPAPKAPPSKTPPNKENKPQ